MSQIESGHAQPALTDLILGKLDIPFTQARAASLALFAFKSGVIFDHIRRDRPPFFDRNSRHAFRESLTIPERVNMWMAGFAPMGRGEVFSMYHTGTMPNGAGLEMYVCTYSIGHFVFQVGAVRNDVQTFSPQSEGFDYLSVPFWPRLPDKLLWPLGDVLRSADQLQAFAERWRDVRVWI